MFVDKKGYLSYLELFAEGNLFCFELVNFEQFFKFKKLLSLHTMYKIVAKLKVLNN